MNSYWWAEHDPENALSPDYPWRITLQTGDNMCHSLEGISFGSEADCLDYIRTHIVGATLDREPQVEVQT